MATRREFLKYTGLAGAGLVLTRRGLVAAPAAAAGLSNPADQPKFINTVPNALDPGFIYDPLPNGKYRIALKEAMHHSGLVAPDGNTPVPTPIWGYGDVRDRTFTWPGRTFEVQSGATETEVLWINALGATQHLLPVDTSLHWCYALHRYEQYSIMNNGVPIVTHLHGGHSDFQFDGNPEFFYSPQIMGQQVVGPQWANVPGGFTNKFRYDNNVPAGNLWYHDHALGITRLNVYAGLAGFYFVRDELDTGQAGNPLGLPAYPYEMALAIQDRMFMETGELFYPAFPGDPFYADFITGEGAILPADLFPGGGPTALAEFFGDHMVVNGLIWPKADVEPRNYRLRLLNGTDSRFMAVQFRAVDAGATDLSYAGAPLPFWVIGSDQGLAASATQVDTLVFEPGSRYDVVIDFSDPSLAGKRVIMSNIGGDEPFGGDIPGPFLFDETDRIMAFDVTQPLDSAVPDMFNPDAISAYEGNTAPVTRTRRVALFEGMDNFGRLQPLLGVAEPTVNAAGQTVNGSQSWFAPTTENPGVGDTEIWEIYNATGDAHPVHLHLVNFEVLNRQAFTADVIQQPQPQHDETVGTGYRLENITLGNSITLGPDQGYVENAPKDMVTALPDQVTRIKATFDKPGRYVWHCHILSHEDHEMMRVLHVGPGA